MLVLHVAGRDAWQAARDTGSYTGSTRGADLDAVGFVHACTAEQLPGVLRRFYRGVDLTGLVLLVVDVHACEAAGSPVRWEVPAGDGEPDEAFPHVHGPVPVAAVIEVRPLA